MVRSDRKGRSWKGGFSDELDKVASLADLVAVFFRPKSLRFEVFQARNDHACSLLAGIEWSDGVSIISRGVVVGVRVSHFGTNSCSGWVLMRFVPGSFSFRTFGATVDSRGLGH